MKRTALTGRRAHRLARREALSREASAAQRRLGRLLLASGSAALRTSRRSTAPSEEQPLCTLLAIKISDLHAQIAAIDAQASPNGESNPA